MAICVEPPCMPALHGTSSATCGDEITRPSSRIATRRYGVAGALHAAAPVRSSHLRLPVSWNATETKCCLPVSGSLPALAEPTSAPMSAAGRMRIGCPLSSRMALSAVVSVIPTTSAGSPGPRTGVERQLHRPGCRNSSAPTTAPPPDRGTGAPPSGVGQSVTPRRHHQRRTAPTTDRKAADQDHANAEARQVGAVGDAHVLNT